MNAKKRKVSNNNRSLFSLLENFNGKEWRYEEHPRNSPNGNYGSASNADINILTEKVKKLVEHDQTLVQRRFWFAAVPFDDSDDYNDDIGTLNDDIEGTVSPLFVAIAKGLEDVVEYLLSQGGDALDYFGMDCCCVNAAHQAIICGNLRILQLLLQSNPRALDRSYCISDGNMAEVAAIHYNFEILDFLTTKGIGPIDKERIIRMMYLPVDEERADSGRFIFPERYKSLDDPRLPVELREAINKNCNNVHEK